MKTTQGLNKTNPERVPALLIDFSKPVDDNIVYPLSPTTKSKSIQIMAARAGKDASQWTTAEAIRLVDAQHGLYSDIPMLCKGAGASGMCEYKSTCPYSESEVEERFKDGNCPVEVVEAFKLFAGYVVDLDIKPTDFTDIQTIVDLVRLHLQLRRCDLYLKDKPIWQENVAGIVQSTGIPHRNKVLNIGHITSRELRADLDKKYQQLVATREGKTKADAASGKDRKDMVSVIKSIQDAAARVQKAANKKAIEKLKEDPVIEAEFNTEE